MSTAPTLARSYEALRPRGLERLLELRATLEPSLGRLDDATARVQIGAVLDHLGNFIATGDLGLHAWWSLRSMSSSPTSGIAGPTCGARGGSRR